jgi:DNA replication and repair protein RecF
VIVTHLSLTDFRNYEEAEVDLVAGPNLFVGSNGQGKTNLVEAIGYLSTLGSHRVATDHALIRTGRDAAIVRARLEHAERSVLTPRLAGVLADYDRVLRQRTTLLKSVRAARVADSQLSTLEVWNERLAALGSEIIVERSALIDRIRPHVADAYRRIAGDDHRADLAARLSILADSAPDDEETADDAPAAPTLSPGEVREAFAAALARVRRQELDRGLTLIGPHRDDLVLTLNGLPAKGYASHGESWSFALALKLAAAATLRADSPLGDPVVILDDVFAELDETRRSRLAGAIADYQQVLITAAVLDDVPDALRAHTVRIRGGQILDAGRPDDARPGEDA